MVRKRTTFREIEPLEGIRPTERELRWFKHIACHGPQSSQYLYELTRDTHSCKDTALRQLRKLRAAGFLYLPQQQRATEKADFKPYIYDLTKGGAAILKEQGQLEACVRPTGHWWHGYAVSCVTSSIEIWAARQSIRYIPTHIILERKNASLAIPLAKGKVIPDQLFALDYGGLYRAFALEVDRGTEPIMSSSERKSLARSMDQYAKIIETEMYKSHYGLKTNLLVLWVFTKATRQAQFLKLCMQNSVLVRQAVLTLNVESSSYLYATCAGFFNGSWQRAGVCEQLICK